MKFTLSFCFLIQIIQCNSFLTSKISNISKSSFVKRNNVSPIEEDEVKLECTLVDVIDHIKPYAPLILTYAGTMFALNYFSNGNGRFGFNDNEDAPGLIYKDDSLSLDEVAGIDYVKYDIEEMISFLQNPKKYEKMGAKIPRGALLSSKPGCGKTLLARAISSVAHVPLLATNGAEFVSIYVGNGPKRMRDLFKKARDNAPCVVFIDEIDAVGGKRGSGPNNNDERESTLNQLLTEMDGFDRNTGIIVIGATNRPDILDPALVRAGRMDRKIHIKTPNAKEREEILQVHSKDKKLNKDVSIEKISRQTVGFTGADLANLMNEAAILAVRHERENITNLEMEESFNKQTIGIRLNTTVPFETDNVVCIHEAGHAMVGVLQPVYDRVSKISVTPLSSGVGGFTLFCPTEENESIVSYNRLCSEIKVLLGGRAAEEVILGPHNITTGAHSDLERVKVLAQRVISEFSMGGLISYTEENMESRIVDLINTMYSETVYLIKENKKLLQKISSELMEKRELDEAEFYKIVEKTK